MYLHYCVTSERQKKRQMPLFSLAPRRCIIFSLTVCICLFSTVSAHAWGKFAHRVVANVALNYISRQTQEEITLLLSSQTLVEVASDADEWRTSRPDTSPWHYVNIPFTASTYDSNRDCPNGDCIIAAIAKYQDILANRSHSQELRREALVFLVHLVADAHQPLHCIDNRDRGGNDVTVTFFGIPTTLHAVWDSELVFRTHQGERAYTHHLMTWLTSQNIAELQRGTTVDWVLGTHALARTYAYHLPPERNLRSGYYSNALPIVDQQLAKAAVRLAYILNEVLQTPTPQ